MKKILLFLLLIPTLSFSQKMGWNTNQFWEEIETANLELMDEMIPEGEKFVFRIRNDKYKKMPDAVIDKIIETSDFLGDKFEAIYVFDTRGVSIADNFYGYDKLKARVKIIASGFGNEEFYPSAGHDQLWSKYQVFVTPIILALNQRGATEDFIFPVAPRPRGYDIAGENRYHSTWNDALIALCNTSDQYQPDFHIYWDSKDMSAWVDSVPGVVLKGYNSTKDNFFKTLTEQFFTSTLLAKTMDYFNAKFPTKRMYITEYGPWDNPGGYQNTMAYAFCHAWFLNELDKYERIEVACKHAGSLITPAGQITSRKQLDAVPDRWVKRLGYYTLQMYMKYRNTHNFYLNMSASDIGPAQNLNVISLTGKYWFSSSGYCSWWLTGSDVSYEIVGYNDQTLSYLPKFSVGYTKELCTPLQEVCNELDDDCDGDIDEGLTQYISYEDKDGDNYGAGLPDFGCVIPPNYVTNNTDCNDNDVTIHPGASEPCGTIDYNCDKVTVVCPPVICYKRVLGIFCVLDKPCKKNNCTK